tara:strand:+ start:1137 stop:1316 length:180 start_codon:yes stop_codon:yes gene_type:complete
MFLIIIALIVWEIYWKAQALWIAARKSHKNYFILILLINSLGVLPIYYLFKQNYFKKTN